MIDIPNPGSPEAHELGCLCPRMDNANGRGYMGGVVGQDGKTVFVVRMDCPLHGRKDKDNERP